jgi:hypothetical protein
MIGGYATAGRSSMTHGTQWWNLLKNDWGICHDTRGIAFARMRIVESPEE